MTEPTLPFNKPAFLDKVFSGIFGFLSGTGLGPPHNYLLQVRGRKTGRLYSTPVDVLSFRGGRFLVGGRPYTLRVRNAQPARTVAHKKGIKRELLRAYLDRFRLTVQRYFPIPAGSPADDFAINGALEF